MSVIYGIHPVAEALKARGRAFEYVAVLQGRQDSRLNRIVEACRAARVPIRQLPREQLNRLAEGGTHQGVVAVTSEKQYVSLEDLLEQQRAQYRFLLVLDGVEDPHNLGAIIRTADATGVDGIVVPERRAVGVTGAVTKASAGASEYVPIARVVNIARALEELKEKNIWTVGLDERGPQTYDQMDFVMNCALVLGAEGKGLHEQVRKKCDFLVSLPMLGRVPSLNVSVAAGVVMYEIARQRREKKARLPKKELRETATEERE
ncbi:MAG TPA: 23S rRNA (guanosine(2251)-2'-O)-methyltransferase RlmB [Terriglobales bacterium]|nr:23S rRNA (guanosine(2251)-2'-O)-methyltransferase RlmB [Terriglobales bacterium]